MKRVTVQNIPFSLWSWEDLEQNTIDLSDQILTQGKQYDRIVALANGGLTMVRCLGDRLGTTKISSVQLSFYQGINDVKREPQIIQPLTTDVSGQEVLIFEDIVDTGATLEFAIEYLRDHGVRSVETASLVYKPHSTIRPEYFGQEERSWVIFPYETQETIQELSGKWKQQGLSVEQVRQELAVIGFPSRDIALYA